MSSGGAEEYNRDGLLQCVRDPRNTDPRLFEVMTGKPSIHQDIQSQRKDKLPFRACIKNLA